MGYAVHQMLVNGSSNTFISFRFCLGGSALMVIYRHCTADCSPDQLFCLVDAVCHRNHDNGLSVKTRHFHILICRNNDCFCLPDFLFRKNILSAAGTIRFCFQGNPQFFPCIFQIFSSHIGMGNSCGTSSDCQHAKACFFRFCCLFRFIHFFFLPKPLRFRLIDNLQELLL